MISAQSYPLKSRNIVDDDSEDFPTPVAADIHTQFPPTSVQPSCLIVQLDNSASVLIDTIIAQTSSHRVGDIVQEGRKSPLGKIFQSEHCRILQFAEAPTQEVCFKLVREIMAVPYTSVLVFDALPIVSHIPGISATGEVWIRYMASVAAAKEVSTQTNLSNIPEVEPGNIVTGLGASLLNYCEYRDIAAVSLLVLRESSLTLSSVQALHASIPLVQQYLQLPQGLLLPDVGEEQRLVRGDPFVSNTTILYV